MADIQSLNVKVPRETMLQIKDLKYIHKGTCSDVVIDAINKAHKALNQDNKKTITAKVSTKL